MVTVGRLNLLKQAVRSLATALSSLGLGHLGSKLLMSARSLAMALSSLGLRCLGFKLLMLSLRSWHGINKSKLRAEAKVNASYCCCWWEVEVRDVKVDVHDGRRVEAGVMEGCIDG